MIVVEEEHKCKECKWLTDKNRTLKGYECIQPEKKAKWDKAEASWMGDIRKVGRYKQPAAPVCKKFEAR